MWADNADPKFAFDFFWRGANPKSTAYRAGTMLTPNQRARILQLQNYPEQKSCKRKLETTGYRSVIPEITRTFLDAKASLDLKLSLNDSHFLSWRTESFKVISLNINTLGEKLKTKSIEVIIWISANARRNVVFYSQNIRIKGIVFYSIQHNSFF